MKFRLHLEDLVLLTSPRFGRSQINSKWILGGAKSGTTNTLGHELPFVQTLKDYPYIRRSKCGGISRIWSLLQCFVVVRTLCQEDFSHLLLDSCTGKYLGACTEHPVTHCWQPGQAALPGTAPLSAENLCAQLMGRAGWANCTLC